ncbi:NAD-dependent epimerase/dehydratase family protein [bacterium]|nr:NAD-dependent epimerase/dehydratase family protein [bacterium]
MKVLVTGAGGFIGSHLAESLVEHGHEVTAFVRYNSKGDWGWLEKSKYVKEMNVVAGDIRDYDSVINAMNGKEVVFHLAALIGIPYSYISPLAYIRTNVEGTYNVLQSARELGIKKVVHTSTSEVYGTAQSVPISEEHPTNPQSPYAASKSGADFMALTYHRSFGLPVVVIRPFNTYGPRQSARAVIPTIITQLLAGKKKIKLGSLHPTRDLTYVKDTVAGFLKAGELTNINSNGQVINLGSNFEISIGNLANSIAEIMGLKVEFIADAERIRPAKSEVERLFADNSKAKRLLNWAPDYSLEKGLKETIDWLGKNMDIYKPDIYNV